MTSIEGLVLAELQINMLAISSSPATPFPLYVGEKNLTWLLNLAAGHAHGKQVELRGYIENPESLIAHSLLFAAWGLKGGSKGSFSPL